ncbi:hypothetical protein D3C77_813240 [compost metagenome]
MLAEPRASLVSERVKGLVRRAALTEAAVLSSLLSTRKAMADSKPASFVFSMSRLGGMIYYLG